MIKNPKVRARVRRKKGIRGKIFGTPERPRMTVFRSNKHIYVQVVDDVNGKTLAHASTLEAAIRGNEDAAKKLVEAKQVGALAAKACAAKNIEAVVFDRNGFRYTGRVAALADGAREAGLKF
ncbi:MAG: large subunit ribosomal protein L18 [Myxococcota bacterium]|jgi:large subunit ribosomal protein L18